MFSSQAAHMHVSYVDSVCLQVLCLGLDIGDIVVEVAAAADAASFLAAVGSALRPLLSGGASA